MLIKNAKCLITGCGLYNTADKMMVWGDLYYLEILGVYILHSTNYWNKFTEDFNTSDRKLVRAVEVIQFDSDYYIFNETYHSVDFNLAALSYLQKDRSWKST